MSTPYDLKAPSLSHLFGIADETGSIDETMLSTVNVRLDQIFRMALGNTRELVVVNRSELEKLVGLAGLETRELKLTLPKFQPIEDGVPDTYLDLLNSAPERLAGNASGRAPWMLIQTPMLRYHWKGKHVHSEVWTRIVLLAAPPKPAKAKPKSSAKRHGGAECEPRPRR